MQRIRFRDARCACSAHRSRRWGGIAVESVEAAEAPVALVEAEAVEAAEATEATETEEKPTIAQRATS